MLLPIYVFLWVILSRTTFRFFEIVPPRHQIPHRTSSIYREYVIESYMQWNVRDRQYLNGYHNIIEILLLIIVILRGVLHLNITSIVLSSWRDYLHDSITHVMWSSPNDMIDTI